VRVGRFALVQPFERATCRLCELAAVGDALALLKQCCHFTFAQPHRVEFLHLVAQQVQARMPVAGGRLGRDTAVHEREPCRVRGAHQAHLRLELAEGVEQLALCTAAHQ
jgi:hypothetical protein